MQGDSFSSVSAPAHRAWSVGKMLVLSAGASACGQKGPLTLPAAPQAATSASAAASAGAR